MLRKKFLQTTCFAFAVACMTVSCTKQSQTKQNEEPKADLAIQQLAQRYTEPIGSDFGALRGQYSSLNETDLKAFWRHINEINKSNGHSTLTETQFSAIFDKLNNESKTRFGTAFNKIPEGNINAVMNFRDNQAVARPPVDPPPGPCITYYYPVNLYEDTTAVASPPFFTYSIVNYWPDDCDGVEAVYQGYWFKSKSITPLGYQTGPVFPIGRFVNGNTHVLFKKSVMLMAFGSIPAINNHKRMAYGGGAEQ